MLLLFLSLLCVVSATASAPGVVKLTPPAGPLRSRVTPPGAGSSSDGTDRAGSEDTASAVFLVSRHSRYGPQNWGRLFSSLQFYVEPRSRGGGNTCALEVVTDSTWASYGHAVSTSRVIDDGDTAATHPPGSLLLTLSPFGRDVGVVVRCSPPTASKMTALVRALRGAPSASVAAVIPSAASRRGWSGQASSPNSIEFDVTVIEIGPSWTHALAFVAGVALLFSADSIASSVALCYLGGVTFATIVLALVFIWACVSAAPGGRTVRRAMTPMAVVAACVGVGVEYVRDFLVSVYARISLWPLQYVVNAMQHPAAAQPAWLAAAALMLIVSAATGFFLVRSYCLETQPGMPTRVLDGPSLFVSVMLRCFSFVLLMTTTSDLWISGGVTISVFAIASGAPTALRTAWRTTHDMVIAIASPFTRALAIASRLMRAAHRQWRRIRARRQAVAAQLAAQQQAVDLAPPIPMTPPPPVYPSSSGTESEVSEMNAAPGGGAGMIPRVRRQGTASAQRAAKASAVPPTGDHAAHVPHAASGGVKGRLSENPCDPEPHVLHPHVDQGEEEQTSAWLMGALARRRAESREASSSGTASALASLCRSPAFGAWAERNIGRIMVLDLPSGPDDDDDDGGGGGAAAGADHGADGDTNTETTVLTGPIGTPRRRGASRRG